jgi:thiopurine S-methyltransferase
VGVGGVKHYSETNIDIFVGNIFDVPTHLLGPVDAVYDRAALVALPEALRNRYTMHLLELTDRAPQLLICYEYDQVLMMGPPFSISSEEVSRHYCDHYDLKCLEGADVAGGLKGQCAAKEYVWLLQSR